MKRRLVAILAALGSAVALAQDGTLDTTFVSPSGYRYLSVGAQSSELDTLGALHVRADGRVLYGLTSFANGATPPVIVDLMDVDGGVAPALFTTATLGTPGASFASLDVQSDGKVLVLINDPTAPFNTCFLYRLLGNGTPDSAFGPGGRVTVPLHVPLSNGLVTAVEVLVQNDGKLLIAAGVGPAPPAGHNAPSTLAMTVTRLFANGQLDTSYGNGGTAIVTRFAELNGAEPHEQLRHARLAVDGGVLLAGATHFAPDDPLASTPVGAFAKLTPSGQPDGAFGDGSAQILGGFGAVKDLAVHGGSFYVVADDTVLRYAADGQRDFRFGLFGAAQLDVADPATGIPGFVVPGSGTSLAIQSDGRIVVGGNVRLVSDSAYHALAYRLTADGFADPAYGDGLHGPGAYLGVLPAYYYVFDLGDGELVALQDQRALLSGRVPFSPGYHGVVYRLTASVDGVFLDGFE